MATHNRGSWISLSDESNFEDLDDDNSSEEYYLGEYLRRIPQSDHTSDSVGTAGSTDSVPFRPEMSSNAAVSGAQILLNSPMNPESNKNIALYGYQPRDPSAFDYHLPYRPQQQSLTSSTPALSSSSSASTRSSAYTTQSNGSVASPTSPNSNVRIASNEDLSPGVGQFAVGITSDSVVQLMSNDAVRAPGDQSRWSASYSTTSRSRSSSVGAGSVSNDQPHPRLTSKKSYDMSWQQALDERDEFGASEEDTDADDLLLDDDDRDDEESEERTAAALVADEGRGLIVKGEGVVLSELPVQPGTTHLLLNSCGSPNSLPAFLTAVVPQICTSLLALDISANFLSALPPTLALCICLEELNIASNPLRVLPVFLADLVHLRVLIADSTGLSTLPDALADCDKLHTISVRRNKMHALPSWLAVLPDLQTLYVDGNPFQGPWKALVEPLLAKVPSTPIYPLSTPTFPTSMHSPSSAETSTDDEQSEPPSSGPSSSRFQNTIDEDHTITPDMARSRSPGDGTRGGLTRTRTTPNRANPVVSRHGTPQPENEDVGYFVDRPAEVRRMKSAGELRQGLGLSHLEAPTASTSRSSTNLLQDIHPSQKRFGSVGPSTTLGVSPVTYSPANGRPPLTNSMWNAPNRVSQTEHPSPSRNESSTTIRVGKDGKEKSRWGFLKKMSMGKMKPDPASPRPSPPRPGMIRAPGTAPLLSGPSNGIPQINMRISTTGALDSFHSSAPPTVSVESESRLDSMFTAPASGASGLLAPGPTPRTTKRRSFLPLDAVPHGGLNIPIPDASAFMPNVTVTGDIEADGTPLPSPVGVAGENWMRREEDRARDAYQRALRSVMAYLKDMNDLGVSQQAAALGTYGQGGEELVVGMRQRRPTGLEREASMASTGSSTESGQLRSLDSMTSMRGSTQTNSVATTDSSGSGSDERKYKDDKGKRAMVVREIVVTERTYVKGLHELVDIYIKPGSAPVNVLGSSSKETVVPASERKVAFAGIEALFSFHKDSFLPALEIAAAPIMKSSADLAEADADGQLSLTVAKAIGSMFLKHAAFMRMYSTYINNFDSAVQRVQSWTRAAAPVSSTPAITPSTSQLAGLGLALSAVSNPVSPESSVAPGLPALSTSQRKRLRTFMKRCQINPRHSQLNLEGYLLLPVQRIPRYRLLLEELLRATPPTFEYMDDPLDRSLAEISLLANNMNEGKRESESRQKLVQWQARIRGRFPSPLVQPHRRLIMDGHLLLTRVVRKAMVSFEALNAQGDPCTVQVDCLAPELTPRPLVGILCNDLLVLCRDPSEGQDPQCAVDLWAVLRMQTLPQPASIVHGNALRLVDNKAILYFDAPTPSDALNWFRAINLHIPKT
ncbi:unnamed protein product [Mycena citricolor]|uniref:DH domain-containing protein n=1 Tax=Mycena citricolor TaxID=2018698 RepID=A0AAD2HRN5_9AGAR|nr:unnamed protein product [Mycena citricolor]